ncbi:hypothetical protein [Streptomyces griseiscabiei]|uniref:Uncharacterized protein n=1 Tax=Streptomyces griseiscabiei TaxID=2993540 RepID=A0ABU4L802_9ACTN|nr:hypothetical protein [Streptomyces griseiscabiei]MBZ3906479.1 hypothetical protein [Streptomyces griseiscabiei]MDX2911475.1 hypothetical protein [Streptomyces griseiscabiei]
MPKKPRTSEQAAQAAPTPQPSAPTPAAPAQKAADPTLQDTDLDELNGETWSNFSEVGDEEDELPER